MKLSKTQRDFRKQMKRISNSATPYNNSRDGNPFLRRHKPKLKSSSFFLVIFCALIIVFAYKSWPEFGFKSSSGSGINMAHSAIARQMALPNSLNSNLALPSSDADFIQSMETFMTSLKEPWQKVSEQHRIPWEKRNIEQYQATLLNGIAVCDQELINLEGVHENKRFQPLKNVVKEYLSYSRLSFKSYLDYTYSKNQSDVSLGNKYITLINQTSGKFNPTLIQLLNQNGYAYEDKGNGQITYYIRP